MKILIGVDDSACSRAALEFVRKLAWPAKTKAIVVSAVHAVVDYYRLEPAAVGRRTVHIPAAVSAEMLLERQTKDAQELVSRVERELRDARLATEARVLTGDPREAIVQTAKDEGADLVVVGSHGRSGIARLFMGSVAAYVVTHAPCSVLVVKTDKRRG